MTQFVRNFADLLDPSASAERRCVIAVLDCIYGQGRIPSRTDNAILAAIRTGSRSARQHRRRRLRSLGALLPVPVLMLGTLASLRVIPPAPVSAAVILQRAAAIPVPANRGIHFVYKEWLGDSTGRYEIWEETDARGTVVRAASTEIEWSAGETYSIARTVDQDGVSHNYTYLPGSKYLTTQTVHDAAARRSGPYGTGIFGSGADVARYIKSLVRAPGAHVRLLSERRFHGVLVYPIWVAGIPERRLASFTAYIDANTYILRGIEGTNSEGLSGAVVMENQLLVKDETVPLSAVPRMAFQFHPPSGSQVIP